VQAVVGIAGDDGVVSKVRRRPVVAADLDQAVPGVMDVRADHTRRFEGGASEVPGVVIDKRDAPAERGLGNLVAQVVGAGVLEVGRVGEDAIAVEVADVARGGC